MSDARWELIEPVLTAWRLECRRTALHFGRPPGHDLRDTRDAISYVDRTGVQGRCLPHDFPPWNTAYGYFAKWADEGVFAQLNGLLRQLLREEEGRSGEPSACVIDAQSVKTSTSVPTSSRAIGAGKKTVGRKRSIVTGTLGLLLAVLVTAASVQDSTAGTRLLGPGRRGSPRHPESVGRLRLPPASRRACRRSRHRHGDHRPQARDQGIHPLPKRWAVEPAHGWLMLHRRLARGCETLPTRSEAMVHLGMTGLMDRRLTSENTLSWRDPKSATEHPIAR
ncbi:IS5 family transposase [Streptomyces omiyaensis]|uniref:IS5 family transposase n=1 Tax=Streptomyces omiyaensis TaxID=68247 RepID=A0ABW7BMJ2_9ACTN